MTAFDNDRWEAERKARLERVGHRETEMTALEKAARAAHAYEYAHEEAFPNWEDANPEYFAGLARAVLMAVLASVETDQSDTFQADDRVDTVLRAILAEPQP